MLETSHTNATGKAADGPQRVKYVRKLDQIGQLSAQERDRQGRWRTATSSGPTTTTWT